MKNAKLSLETAKALYNQGGVSRQFALDNFTEEELTKPLFDVKEFLLSFFNDFNYKVDRVEFPKSTFFGFDKQGNFLFEYEKINNRFYLSYDKIWLYIANKTGWGRDELQNFVRGVVIEHFQISSVIIEYEPESYEKAYKKHFNKD
jgi:hypothetical protein